MACVAVKIVPYRFVVFIFLSTSKFKNEPLVLALIAPITSSDSAGVVVPTPKLVPNEPEDTVVIESNPKMFPKLPLMFPLPVI